MSRQRPRSTPWAVLRRTRAQWRRLAPFFGSSRLKLSLLALVSIVAGLAEASLLALVATIAEALSSGEARVEAQLGPVGLRAELSTLFVVGTVLALVRGALQVWLAYLPAGMAASAMAGLRRQLFEAFTRTAWSVQASERDGHFQSLMLGHVNKTSQAVTILGTGISAALMFVTLLATAFVLSVPTALVILVASVGLFLVLRPLSRRLRKHAKALSEENMEYSKGVQEIVLMAEETQVFGSSEAYRQQFQRSIDRVRRPMLATRFLSRALPGLFQSLALLLLILALVAVSVIGSSGIAALGAVVLMLIRSMTYGQQIQTAISSMDELVPFMHRLGDAIDHYRAHPQQDGEELLPRIERLGMTDVHFSYVPGKEVLTGIDFTAHRGEAIGIVGPSGAGKSSVVQLLLRLRDPDAGMLHVNGSDARTFRREQWRRQVAYVPQTPQLIWGTVRENIRFHRPEVSDADIESAARRAHIHDEIRTWPQGYDTVIGQRAAAVSGGQRQRLCLARALAGGPSVLILDEPTSALDVQSEMLVQESLKEAKAEVMLFLVAHRLSTLSVCDRVMVVVDGRLEAMDEPAELLTTSSFYREVNQITHQQTRT